MDYAIREIAPQVWRVDINGVVRIIRYRPDTFQKAWAVTAPMVGKIPSMPASSHTPRSIRTSTEPVSSTKVLKSAWSLGAGTPLKSSSGGLRSRPARKVRDRPQTDYD